MRYASLGAQTMGMADVLWAALAPLAAPIEAAFVYGSVAEQQGTAQSDVDVLIVSAGLGYADVFGAHSAPKLGETRVFWRWMSDCRSKGASGLAG